MPKANGTSRKSCFQDESYKKQMQFICSSPTVRVFRETMQSLRKHNVFCDIKFETDDGVIVFGHKVVLSSATPYFYAMFTQFEESNKDNVNIKEMESTTLKLLVDFIYTGQIIITEENVLTLLPAASLLQLHDVRDACCDFLKAQMDSTNCLGIKEFAELHSCMELLLSSEIFIQQHFLEMVDGDEFLSLSFEQLLKLISSFKLNVSTAETVVECVKTWVNHEPGYRQDLLPKLIEYVRLRKPAQYIGSKVILVVGGEDEIDILNDVKWYDPITHSWHIGPDMIDDRYDFGIAALKDGRVFLVGGSYVALIDSNAKYAVSNVHTLDLSLPSPSWVPSISMLEERKAVGVAVLNNSIYAVGGINNDGIYLKSAEKFGCKSRGWQKISDMATRRRGLGVGVLKNVLYAVGGFDGNQCLKSVECYHPKTNKWTPIADMSVCRYGAGVGVLGDVMYAVGGINVINERSRILSKSVEYYDPSTRVWTYIADMHMCRSNAGVFTLDGLLYVVGGFGGNDDTSILDSVEIYNPKTKTWSMSTISLKINRASAGVVVIDKFYS